MGAYGAPAKAFTVFSYYEFVEPLGSRLTDEEWQKRLENNKAANEKAKLALEEKVSKSEAALASRELDIKEAKDKADNKIDKQGIALQRETVELEKDQLIYGNGQEQEIKNNF